MDEKRKLVEDWNTEDHKINFRIGKRESEKFICADGQKRTLEDIGPIDLDLRKDGKLVITPAYAGFLKWYREHKKQWQKTVKDQTIILDDVTLTFWDWLNPQKKGGDRDER
jgi:hypothetical protein